MTIKAYRDENGKTLYQVSVSARSKLNSKIRKQKRRKGIQTKVMATKIEKALLQDCITEVTKLDGEGYFWGQICEKWHIFKQKDEFEPLTQNTLTDYIHALRKWTKNQWEKPANQFSRADVKRVIVEMDKDGRSKNFQAKIKYIINNVFNWGLEEELIKGVHQSPTIGIKVNKKSERKPTILTKQEMLKLLNAAKHIGTPWYPIWATALLTGCRSGELLALTWNDVDFSNSRIRVSKSYDKRNNRVKETKSGRWRNVPMNTDLKNLLLELKRTSTTEEILPRLREWLSGKQAEELKKFCIGIGITPIRFHDLRACFATQLLQNKVAPAAVMKICGWKELDTMAHYIRLAGIDETGATDSLLITPQQTSDSVISINSDFCLHQHDNA
jgi:integrase